MNPQLKVEGYMVQRLRTFREPVEVRDAEGNLLGVYTPHLTPEQEALLERDRQLFDLEEVERQAALNQPGRSLAEIKESWKAMSPRT